MKSSFDREIHSTNSFSKRSKFRLWLFLLILASIAVASYFIMPKFFKSVPEEEKKVEDEQPIVKEQIIKNIPLPRLNTTN
jgi:flagellar basal body-associated protein FliL